MRLLKSLLANVKARKGYIAYSLIALILVGIMTGMLVITYSQHDKHRLEAGQNGQLVVYDVTTGEKVDIATLIHKDVPKTDVAATAKANAPTQPAPPIKQADIMFIIDNLGSNKADTESAIALPPGFMLSFSPYADLSLELSEEAKTAGHVILADLPMGMKDANETAGNLALSTENNNFKNSRNLQAVLSKVYQPSGVLSPPNDTFSQTNIFTFILQELAKHKVFLAYAGEGEDIDTKAKDNDVGLLKIDVVLDENDLANQLKNVETQIAKTGLAVVMIKNPSSASIAEIKKWAALLGPKNIHIVSSSK